jgi:hypothetical protein
MASAHRFATRCGKENGKWVVDLPFVEWCGFFH